MDRVAKSEFLLVSLQWNAPIEFNESLMYVTREQSIDKMGRDKIERFSSLQL